MFSLCFISQYFSFNVFEFNLLVILVCEDICIWYFVDVCFCVFPPIFCLQCLSISYLILGMCWNMYLIFYWPLLLLFFPPNILPSIFINLLVILVRVEICIWYFIDLCLRIHIFPSIFFNLLVILVVLKCVFDILLMSASGILHFVIVPYVDINYHTSQIGITEN